jgi:hypothetical protein
MVMANPVWQVAERQKAAQALLAAIDAYFTAQTAYKEAEWAAASGQGEMAGLVAPPAYEAQAGTALGLAQALLLPVAQGVVV